MEARERLLPQISANRVYAAAEPRARGRECYAWIEIHTVLWCFTRTTQPYRCTSELNSCQYLCILFCYRIAVHISVQCGAEYLTCVIKAPLLWVLFDQSLCCIILLNFCFLPEPCHLSPALCKCASTKSPQSHRAHTPPSLGALRYLHV